MKSVHYYPPKSSFNSMNKDYQVIIQKILSNDNLKKMLYYPVKECMSMPALTQEQTYSLIENGNIRIVPKITVEDDLPIYIVVTFNNFYTNVSNPEYRDCTLSFDIICHFDTWNLGDFKLRPYSIAGELDGMFNDTNLIGMGKLYFVGADYTIMDSNIAALSLRYRLIHGETEDKNV